jgi:Tol biopolymer transport system component/DNA-binding winged helix-turn-helix (wHTH) protein
VGGDGAGTAPHNVQGVPQQDLVTYSFGDVRVDPAAFRVTRGGQAVHLEPKAFDVLLFLIENRGRLVEKAELQAALWKDVAVTENTLTRLIAQLRKSLGDDAREGRVIETVPTRGYRFVAPVALAASPAPPALASPGPAPGRRPSAALPGLLGSALALGAVAWLAAGRSAAPERGVPPAPRRTALSQTRGFNAHPTFTPDGSSVAFVSDRTGAFEIYLRPLAAGAREAAVTSDGQDNVHPAVSPDGRHLAYHSRGRGGIWLVPVLGGVPRHLSPFGSRPAFSPDGGTVAFQSSALVDRFATGAQAPSTLWTVGVGGGTPVPLTRAGAPPGGHGSPAWSPDGRRLAFVADGLWTVARDGGEPVRLSDDEAAAKGFAPAYGRDGRLYFGGHSQANARLFRVPLSSDGLAFGGPVEELANGADSLLTDVAVAPDGSALVYSAFQNWTDIYSLRLDPDGEAVGEPQPLTSRLPGRKTLPTFSPDGSHIAFTRFNAGMGVELWLMGAEGAEPRQVTTWPVTGQPSFFPGGDRVGILTRGQDGWDYRSIGLADGTPAPVFPGPREGPVEAVAPAHGAEMPVERLRLGARPAGARLTPDGRSLVFHAQKAGGPLNVFLAAVGEQRIRQLTRDPEGAGWPAVSPDGRTVALEIFRGPGHAHVGVTSLEGGAIRQLTSAPGQDWVHDWSPDGRKIAFAGMRDGVWNLYWVGADGAPERRLTHESLRRVYLRYPAWSPRGDRMVFERGELFGQVWLQGLKAGS